MGDINSGRSGNTASVRVSVKTSGKHKGIKRYHIFVLLVLFLLCAYHNPNTYSATEENHSIEKNIFSWRTYDRSIPTPTEFLGYEPGDHHTTYGPMVDYFRELVKRSKRILFKTYGQSYERHPLYYAIISTDSNIQRLAEIKENLSLLANPDLMRDSTEIQRVLDTTPAVVILNSCTHGNETTAFESAIHTAYQLVAATDEETLNMLANLIVLITPAMNPDGHERYVSWYNASQVGKRGTADPNAAEHFGPWEVNTTNNHFQINLNRESCWNTQTESRAMVRLCLEWNPHVFVDHHGAAEGFIGPWYTEPMNAEITDNQKDWLVRFGTDMARLFKTRGFRYTPWEFGILYPGYWETFPLLTGSIAFSIESAGGALQKRLPGGHITGLKEGILHNLLCDQATIQLTAQNRREKLQDFLTYKRSAIEEGKKHPVQAYVFPATNDPQRLDTVINILIREGIKVLRSKEPFRATKTTAYFKGESGPRIFASGSYWIPMTQPQNRLLRVLMSPDAPIPKTYLTKVQGIRKLSETPGYLNPNIWATTEMFYDVTAWALPLTYDLEAYMLPEMPDIEWESVTTEVYTPGNLLNPEADFAYAFDYSSNRAIAAIGWLRRHNIKQRVASSPFRIGKNQFRRGAILVFSHENKEIDLRPAMQSLVQESGITILGIDQNLVDEGPHLGSDQYLEVVNGRVAVVMGGPVRPSSYGSIWFLFEQVYNIPFTALDFNLLSRIDLYDYDVLIFPDGFYSGLDATLEAAISKKLTHWVMRGGSIISIKGASAWFTKESMGLTRVQTLYPYVGKSINMTDGTPQPLPFIPPEDSPSGERAAQPESAPVEQLTIQITPIIPGAILRAVTSPQNYLTYGYGNEIPVLVWSSLVFSAPDDVGVPVFFDKTDSSLILGFAFPDSLENIAGTPYLMDENLGLGHVILYAEDPNFRLYWDGLTRLFFNSILFSNSF